MLTKKLLHINSRNRNLLEDSNSFAVDLNSQEQNVVRVGFNHICLIHSFYNVPTAKDIVLYGWQETGVGAYNQATLTITVAAQHWTITTLVAHINASLQAAFSSIFHHTVVAYSTTTGKLTWTSDNLYFFGFHDLSTGLHLIGVPTADINTTPAVSDTYRNNYTAPQTVDLSGYKFVYLAVSFGNNTIDANDGNLSQDVVVPIPITTSFGDIIHHDIDPAEYFLAFPLNPLNLSSFQVQLRNEDNELIANNNTDWVLLMTLWT